MRYRLLALAAGIAAAYPLPAKPLPCTFQSQRTTKKTYTPPKTPWGDPDLQGNWPAQFNIPMQRAGNFKDKDVLSDEEFAQTEAQAAQQSAKRPEAVRESDHDQSAAVLE